MFLLYVWLMKWIVLSNFVQKFVSKAGMTIDSKAHLCCLKTWQCYCAWKIPAWTVVRVEFLQTDAAVKYFGWWFPLGCKNSLRRMQYTVWHRQVIETGKLNLVSASSSTDECRTRQCFVWIIFKRFQMSFHEFTFVSRTHYPLHRFWHCCQFP